VSHQGPVLLSTDHIVEDFDCGTTVLNEWLQTKALHNQREGSSRTWVVLDGRLVAAFYASNTAVFMRSHATKRAGRNQPDPLPAVLLGRLAVDTKYQGRGFAAALLKHFVIKSLEIAELTGVRLLLVHAMNETAQRFYLRHGFEPSPVDNLTLMLLVKDVRPSSSA